MSIRRRLYVLVGVALLPAVLIQVLDQVLLRQQRRAEVENAVIARAQRAAAQIDQVIEGARQVALAMAQLREVRGRDMTACTETLAALQKQYPAYSSLTAVGLDGRAICTSLGPDALQTMDLSDREYFRQALATDQLYVGGLINSRYQPRRVLPITAPFRDSAGEQAGVVIVAIRLEWLADALEPYRGADGALTVADSNGMILVRFPDNDTFVGRAVPAEIWDRARAASVAGTFTTRAYDDIERVVGFIPPSKGPGGLYVATGVSVETAFAALNTATLYGAALVGAGILAALVLAHLTGVRLIRGPLDQMLAAAGRWRAGDLTARSCLSGPTEFGRLGVAFDGMAADLERAFSEKDLLLRELSHRVTNSLASIAGLLRLQAARSDPEVRRQLNDAVGRIQVLALTYRRLQMGEGGDRLDFGRFLQDLWQDLLASVASPDIRGEVDAQTLLITPEQAAPLAIIAHELLTNGYKHSQPRDGPVVLRLRRVSDAWCLSVSNPGTLPPGFDPNSSDGFGLAMATVLARQVEGHLEASACHGRVEISLMFILRPDENRHEMPGGHSEASADAEREWAPVKVAGGG